MTVSIGIDYAPDQWKICVVDQGSLTEFHAFATASELLAFIRQVCSFYPEPTIVLPLDVLTPFRALQELTDKQLERLAQSYHAASSGSEVCQTLLAIRSLTSRSYCAPSVTYLPAIPQYRRLIRPSLGSAREVCAIVTLLHYMREQEATWQEMNFIYVNASQRSTCALVLQDGQVVNGIGTLQGSSPFVLREYLSILETTSEAGEEAQQGVFQSVFQEAFWEGLTQELAGLMAIHHIEDIVVLGQESSRLIERLANIYQVYLFPYAHTNREGYEIAFGAALLAESLDQPGKAAELVGHLRISEAGPVTLPSES